MPISQADLAEATKVSLDDYLRNTPVDQIGTQHPLLRRLLKKRKAFHGARQNVTENVRKSYDSNFQFGYGETPIVFNKRHTTEQVMFPWRRATDALYLDHDRLLSLAAGLHGRARPVAASRRRVFGGCRHRFGCACVYDASSRRSRRHRCIDGVLLAQFCQYDHQHGD